MNNESPGFFRQLPSALPGLALIIVTMVVIRLWVEPWMAVTKVFGMQKPLTDAFHLNYILLGILCGLLYRNVIFGGRMPEIFSNGFKLSRLMIKSGIILLKYWLEVSPDEQTRRLESRIDDGRKIWKLSPMDLKSYDRWDDYTKARDEMFAATDTAWAPWFVARSEDKKRVRLNVISHLLKQVPYKAVKADKVRLPKRKIGRYKAADYPFRYIEENF